MQLLAATTFSACIDIFSCLDASWHSENVRCINAYYGFSVGYSYGKGIRKWAVESLK